MGHRTRSARVAFATALATGVALVGVSVHGMLGIDRQLERTAQAAQGHQVATPPASDPRDCPVVHQGV